MKQYPPRNPYAGQAYVASRARLESYDGREKAAAFLPQEQPRLYDVAPAPLVTQLLRYERIEPHTSMQASPTGQRPHHY